MFIHVRYCTRMHCTFRSLSELRCDFLAYVNALHSHIQKMILEGNSHNLWPTRDTWQLQLCGSPKSLYTGPFQLSAHMHSRLYPSCDCQVANTTQYSKELSGKFTEICWTPFNVTDLSLLTGLPTAAGGKTGKIHWFKGLHSKHRVDCRLCILKRLPSRSPTVAYGP